MHIIARVFWFAAASMVTAGCPTSAPQNLPKTRKSSMKIEVNQLRAEVGVINAQIKDSDDLEIRVAFTNLSQRKLRLNARVLNVGTVLLSFRKADGTPVKKGPPPMPPADDGGAGRIDLAPGGSVSFTYHGYDIFSGPLAPGVYQVRFRYHNEPHGSEEWVGTIETEWLTFQIAK